jgi:hypothetical protein
MSESEIIDCFYQPHEYDGMADEYVRMVELMENQPRQDERKRSKASTLRCSSCMSDVVPVDDAAVKINVNDGTSCPTSTVCTRMMDLKTSRWPLERDDDDCCHHAGLLSTSSCGSFCFCFRGLETRQRQADKVAIRKRACRAVLTAQRKSTPVELSLPLHGSSTAPVGSQCGRHYYYDVNAIALAYRMCGKTRICQRRAHAFALDDDDVSAFVSDNYMYHVRNTKTAVAA